jgi:hypothetical protein
MPLNQWGRQPMAAVVRMPLLKRLFWIYFLLLIFEGALRKWFLPQFSAPLLLVRDPIALLIIWEAYRTQRWPKQWSGIIGALTVSLLALALLQMIAGGSPWFVAVYGLRSYILPFPVAFIMGANLDEEDLRKFGVCILWLVIPMTLLAVAQYEAGPSSFLNAGAYQGGEQLGYAGGHVRASGTFSYVTGPGSFFPLAAAFIFYGLADQKFAKRWLLWAASGALILSIPVTGSRGMLATLLTILAFVIVAALSGLSQLASSVKVIVALLIVSVLISKLPVFSEATSTFQDRLSQAGGEQGQTGGIVSRLVYSLTPSYSGATDEWYGHGIGLGSNVASTLLTGSQVFLGGEGEFARILFEFGPVFGMAFMIFRLLLAILVAIRAYGMVREQKPLSWFLIPLVFTGVTYGVLEQPTVQGFTVITLGFALAALNRGSVKVHQIPSFEPRLVRARFKMRA